MLLGQHLVIIEVLMSGTELSTVYSYGGGEALYYIFNSLAMLFRGNAMNSLFNVMVMVGLLWAGIKSGIDKDKFGSYTKWFMRYIFVLIVLIQPTHIFGRGMTVHIRDIVTGQAKHVDNLPPGLVIPASFISGLGYGITKGFETVFTTADSNYLPYHKYGTMFGAGVISEFRNIKIQDPVFRENLESFISNCMAFDVMIGKKYDIQEVYSSSNLFKLIKDNASHLRMFNYRTSNKGGRELLTCKAGIEKIEKQFSAEIPLLSKAFATFSNVASKATSGSIKSSNSSIKSSINPQGIARALEASLNFYNNPGGVNASEQLRQLLVINAFQDKPSSYGAVKAIQHQNSAWRYTGEISQQILPIMHALFQALIYASFPFIVCLMFFPQGFRALGTHFGMMIWIELWCPLFAVLNLMVSIFSKISGGAADPITIHNINNMASTQYSYAMAAASLGMLIPSLSYMIVKGGAGQFVHIAGQLTGSTSAGIQAATQEITTGNRSLDNVNIGNQSFNNMSANKYDNTGDIKTGYWKNRSGSGSEITDLYNKRIMTAGANYTASSGNTGISVMSNVRRNLSNQVSDNQAITQAQTEEASTLEQNLQKQTVDYVAKIAENQSKGENYNIDTSTTEGKALVGYLNKARELQQKYNYGWEQATNHALNWGVKGEGAIKGEVSTKKIPLSGAEAEAHTSGTGKIGYDGATSATNKNTQDIGDVTTFSSKTDNTNTYDSIIKASKNIHYSENQSKEKSLGDTMSNSYEELSQKREAISLQQNKTEQLQKTLDNIESSGMCISQSKYDEVLHEIANKKHPLLKNRKIGLTQAQHMIENNDEVFQDHMKMRAQRDIESAKLLTTSEVEYNRLNKLYSTIPDKDSSLALETKAKLDAFKVKNNTKTFKEKMQNQNLVTHNVDGSEIKEEYQKRDKKAKDIIDSQKVKTDQEADNLNKKIIKAEQSRSFLTRLGLIGKRNRNIKKEKWSD